MYIIYSCLETSLRPTWNQYTLSITIVTCVLVSLLSRSGDLRHCQLTKVKVVDTK